MSQGAVVELHIRVIVNDVKSKEMATHLAVGMDRVVFDRLWDFFPGVESVSTTFSSELTEVEE